MLKYAEIICSMKSLVQFNFALIFTLADVFITAKIHRNTLLFLNQDPVSLRLTDPLLDWMMPKFSLQRFRQDRFWFNHGEGICNILLCSNNGNTA